MVLTGIIYGIKPYGASAMGWGNPFVVTMLVGGLAVLGLFVVIERRVDQPMLDLELFSVRPFTMGNIAALLASIGRGGFQFMLIIWLQGIWLPLHGFDFARTPLWAGIYLMPLTAGFLAAGPLSGWLSDHFGARPFATGGMLLAAASFLGMMALPANFSYPVFAAMLLVNGMAFGMFASPNMASVMNSVPARHRGAASGTLATFQNAGFPLSPGQAADLTGRAFFPQLISGPFRHGLVVVLAFAALMCLIAAATSWMRGGKFVHEEAGPHLTVARSNRQDRPSPSARGNGHGAGTGRAASSREHGSR